MINKDQKRNLYIMIGAAAVSGTLVICTLGQNVHRDREIVKQEAAAHDTVPYCIVKAYNGKLGVFLYVDELPYDVINVNINLLSEFDKNQFMTGVALENESELKKVVEDFSD
ncbi:MAG: hypothetical protein MJ081_07255 [Ruminococcus sp.]|nr:hypothetical protein [Ruminococcus sp.]